MRTSHRLVSRTLLAVVALTSVASLAPAQTGVATETVPPRYTLSKVPKGYQLCNAEDDYESYSTSRGDYVSIMRDKSGAKEYRVTASPSFRQNPQEYVDNLVKNLAKNGATATKVHGLPAAELHFDALIAFAWIERSTRFNVVVAGESTETGLSFAESVVPTGEEAQPFTLKSVPSGYTNLYTGFSKTQVPPKPAALSHVGWRLEKDGDELGSLSLDISFAMPKVLDVFFGPTNPATKETTINKKVAYRQTTNGGERTIVWMQEPEVLVVVRSSKLDYPALESAASSIKPWTEKAFQRAVNNAC